MKREKKGERIFVLNVQIIHNNVAQCFIPVCIENVISMYCRYKGVEYENVFLKGYDFRFDKKLCTNKRIADGLQIKYDCTQYLEELYGIKTERKIFNDFAEVLNFLNNQLKQDTPCIIHMDSYYLKWSNYYKKEHTEHLILAVGIDNNSKTIDVIDSIDRNQIEKVSFDVISKGCTFAVVLNFPNKRQKVMLKQIEKEILDGTLGIVRENAFSEMKDFANCFLEFFSPDIEFRDKNNINLMATEKLVDEIRKYIKGINLFVIWLIWNDEVCKNQRFFEIIILYRQIMSKWTRFINTLLKNSITKWELDFGQKAYNEIMDIVNLEIKAYKDFLICIKNKHINTKTISLECPVVNRGGVVFMNLRPFMNNNGFSQYASSEEKDLTGAGEYFVFNKKIEGINNYNNIPFCINSCNEYDNVVCCGQELSVNSQKKVICICIVCCAEWGSCVERIEIIGKDGKKVFFPFFVKDLSECKEENICIKGKTYNKEMKIIRNNAAIFMEVIKVETEIKKIVLPKASNVHILAITLITIF